MFKFFKLLIKKPEPERAKFVLPPPTSYQTAFRRLAEDLWSRHSRDDSEYDNLLYSMASIEHEINHNGGGNWNCGDYEDYLDTVKVILSADLHFTSVQITEIQRCVDEIAGCGRELRVNGVSSRNLCKEIDCLVAHTVDWCRNHPRRDINDG